MPESTRKRFVLGGVIGVVVIAAIIVAVWQWPRPASRPTPVIVTQKLPPPEAATKPKATPPTTKPNSTASKSAAGKTHAESPSFDIVRVAPDGSAVIAGRATPGAQVTVRYGNHVLGKTTADSTGSWVLVPEKPLPPGRRELSLSARAKNGTVTQSEGVVAMMVPPRPGAPATKAAGTPPTVSSAKPSTPAAVASSSPITSSASVPSSAGAKPGTAAPGTGAKPAPQPTGPVAVLLPKNGPAKALQLPPLKGKGQHKLSLDIIEYGKKGDVVIQGRSAPKATVEAYLNKKPVGKAVADAHGHWAIIAGKKVAPGRYQLTLKAHSAAGKQVAELTSPFERAVPPSTLPQDLYIVQPGNCLWRIARRTYGHGIRYIEIYQANRHQIHNPNLIFPGQLLKVPSKS